MSMKMQEKNKTNGNMLRKELPPSSYEVIHLPTNNNTYKSPTNNSYKGLRGQQQGAKRQKVVTPITPLLSQVGSHSDEFRSTFSVKCPSFTETLSKSQVTSTYWMGLPQSFCRMHLPLDDTNFILEYENGKQYKVKYFAESPALGAGWKEFSLTERLSEGDVLEFELVNPTKFMVHRVKENGLSEVNGAHITLDLDARVEPNGTFTDGTTVEKNKEKHLASSLEELSRAEDHVVIPSEDDYDIVQKVDNAKKNRPEQNSGNSEHSQSPPILGDYNNVTTFDDFTYALEELLDKDYKLPNHINWSYFQLCSTQKSVIHANLVKGINPTFIAGCIIETVDISNAIKSCDLSTFDHNFPIWDRRLKSLEFVGMNVKFLSDRLLCLQKIACNSEVAKKKQQYMDLCTERVNSEYQIKKLQDELNELKKKSEKIAGATEKLKMDIKENESRFWEQLVNNQKRSTHAEFFLVWPI